MPYTSTCGRCHVPAASSTHLLGCCDVHPFSAQYKGRLGRGALLVECSTHPVLAMKHHAEARLLLDKQSSRQAIVLHHLRCLISMPQPSSYYQSSHSKSMPHWCRSAGRRQSNCPQHGCMLACTTSFAWLSVACCSITTLFKCTDRINVTHVFTPAGQTSGT